MEGRGISKAKAQALISLSLLQHEGGGDPHPGYQPESEKGAANGYPALDASSRVVQNPANANLLAIAGLSGLADRIAYWTGVSTMALATLTAFGRSVLALADAAAGRTLLDVDQAGTATSALAAHTAAPDPHPQYAPAAGPQYLLLAAHDDVDDERYLDLGPRLEGTDAGAGGKYTLDHVGTWRAFDIDEDLCTTTAALGWGAGGTAGGAFAPVAGLPGHPGVWQLTTANQTGNTYRAYLGTSATGTLFAANDIERFAVLVQLSDVTSSTFSIGIGDSLGNHGLGNNAVSFEADTAIHANWRCSSKSGGNQEGPTASNVAVVSTNWYLLEVRRDAATGNLAFYINGALVATHTTQKPSVAVSLGMALTTQANATRSANLDWYRLRSVPFAQRHT